MPTNPAIDVELLKKAMSVSKAKAKNETINLALKEYLRSVHRTSLARRVAASEGFGINAGELAKMRGEK